MKISRILLSLSVFSVALLVLILSPTASKAQNSASDQTLLQYPTAIEECNRRPVLFDDRGLRSHAVPISRSVRRLGKSRNFTNRAGSLCVPAGWYVQLYKNRNYGPPSMNVYGETALSFTAGGWNNEVTSVRVFWFNNQSGRWEEQVGRES